MPAWPTTLPLYLSGVTDQRGSTKIRSNVDVGPAIQRRRYTSAVRAIGAPVRFTADERDIFDAFYANDLEEGTLSFDWVDPVTGTTVSMRFATEDGPQFTGSEGGNVQAWTATLALEILP